MIKKSTITFGDKGHMIAISSPIDANDLIMELTRRNDPLTLELRIPSWEMNPNLTEERLREEYKFDLASFYRDCAVKPGTGTGQMFPDNIRLYNIRNVLKENVEVEKTLQVFAIDPAIKTDAFGIACGYKDINGKIIIDGCDRFINKEGDPYISPQMVTDYVMSKIDTHHIAVLLHDTWTYTTLIEKLNNRGVYTEQHIVNKEDYDLWKSLIDDDKLEVVNDDVLRREMTSLVIRNERKVDHPVRGSKDVADCVANIIQYLYNNDIYNIIPVVCRIF